MAAKAKKKIVQEESKAGDFSPWWRVGAYLMAACVLGGALFYAGKQLGRDDVLPITELRVVGEFDKVGANQLKDVLTREMDGNFFTVDVDRIHARVVDLPWVHFAWVDRIWPNVLQLRVVEQKPVAYLEGVGLINSEGELFVRQRKSSDENLPVLKGAIEDRDTLLDAFTKYNTQLMAYGNALAQLELNDRGSWRMRLRSGTDIIVGQEEAERRLSRFLDIFGDKLINGSQQYERIDLRYANGFSLRGSENSAQTKQSLNVVS